MNIQNNFLQLGSEPDFTLVLKSVINKIGLELNCIRIGIIQSFNAADLTAEVLIANKKNLGLNKDGTQNSRDYALVTAKICYCTPYITYPIKQGDECILLFNDREIESWFITGEVQPEAYTRMHDLTDCVAIVGLRSLATMIQIMADTLHLFYAGSDIQINEAITINSKNGGNIKADSLITIANSARNLGTLMQSLITAIEGITINTSGLDQTSIEALQAVAADFNLLLQGTSTP